MEQRDSDEPLYTPRPAETQLTGRAVLAGCVIGGAIAAMNLHLGLKTGWTVSGSVMAATLGVGLFAALRPRAPYSVLEANITQTTASGAGTMAAAGGLISAIPAMKMLGHPVPVWALFVWGLAVAYLGVMFAVPLRRQYVLVEKLRFPSGAATANTILAMFAGAGEATAKARVLLVFALLSFVYMAAAHFVPAMEMPPLHDWLGSATLASLAAWGFSLYLGPMLAGAGLLIGPRVGVSLAAGAIAGWGLLGHYIKQKGLAPHAEPMAMYDGGVWGVRGWILWPGVALMVAEAVMSLALSWRTVVRAFVGAGSAVRAAPAGGETIPDRWWLVGLGAAATATLVLAWLVFAIPPHLSLFAILLSAFLTQVAVRATGETDINPAGGLVPLTQASLGALSASIPTNIMAAAITDAGANQSSDLMQDLKTGHLLGASPRSQFKAQLVGIFTGVLCAVPLYLLFDRAWNIGSERLAAPSALLWKAVAEVMSRGVAALPPDIHVAVLVALVAGALLPVIRTLVPRLAPWLPSGMAFGLAFLVPAFYSLTICAGAVGLVLWRAVNRGQCERLMIPVACGLLAGEGFSSVVNALLTIAGK